MTTMHLPPRVTEPPWVKCWRSAREHSDVRHFPEQIPALAEYLATNPDADPIPAQPFTDRSVWVQIGEYGYEGCAYDFNAPVESNRICVMHPHAPNAQPLSRVLVGGLAFMLCLDCKTAYEGRKEEI
jgi:hypothetical protein